MEPTKGVTKLDDFAKFPDEIVIEILRKLDPKSLINICLTSKRLNILCKDKHLWRLMYRRDVSKADPCLPLNWEKLYGVAFTQYVREYMVRIHHDEYFVLGEDNLNRNVDQFLKDDHGYDDEDIEVFHINLFITNGDPDVAMLVDDDPPFYTTDDGKEIEIREAGRFPVRDIFNLFQKIKKMKPEKQ